MDGNLIVAIIGTAITTLGLAAAGLWAYNEAVKREFESMDKKFGDSFQTMFRRMDENKKQFYDDFLLKEIHDESAKHNIELNDQKFVSLIKLFETNLNYLTIEVKSLRDQISK